MPQFPWNYGGDPASSDRDAVRFLVGDTIKERPLVYDKEVDYALSSQGSVVRAAAFVCDALAAKFSSQADVTIVSISKSFSSLADKFSQRAKDLRSDANVNAEFFFGGNHKGDVHEGIPFFNVG